MGELTLIKRNGEKIPLFSRDPFCTLKSAQQNISLMGDDTVSLTIISTQVITFDKGDKIFIGDDEYTIRTTVNREKISDDYYSYEPVFYGVMYELMKSLYRNAWLDLSGKIKSDKSVFDLTYTIKDFVKVIIYNLERDYPGLWKFDADNCPETEAITIAFSRQNCLQVLQSLCSKENFNLDFKITQKDGVRTIHIGKFGTKVVPPGGSEFFEWGKGNGLYKLKEEKVDDKAIKTRLWVEGGSTNIRSNYRDYAGKLQLPYPQRLNKHDHTLRDGTVVKAGTELIGITDDTKRYFEDAELAAKLGSDEDAEEYDYIYPKRTGTVTALAYETDKNGNKKLDVNSFLDDTMDFDLNEKDSNGTTYLIDGTSAKITFISGKLAGQEFELAKYNHSQKKFTMVPFTDERGLTTPTADNEAFQMMVGDQYKLTDINLPKPYEDDAEEDLWYEGRQDFDDARQARAKYTLTLDRMYFLDNTARDSSVCIFQVGDYAPVRDSRFGIEKTIRITKVQRNLMLEQDYTITLSDTNTINIATQTVIDVINHETIINANRLRDFTKARRGWRTTEELRNMIYDTDGYFDTDHIRPLSIDTNMLTVGSKSQQFILTGAILEANVNGFPNRFNASGCVLSHLTISDTEIRNWNIAAADFTLDNAGGYYLFARCPKNGSDGTWYLTQQQLKVEPTDDPNNYYFQVGVLGSLHADDDFRDFVTTYGFTRINGNTITTGKIITSDGECYLDLDNNAFRIGDDYSSIDWNVTARNQITLHRVRLLSDSGDTSNIGVYRGTYNPNYVYYTGDEVSYTNGGETCTYRYKHPDPGQGIAPTTSTHWDVIAKGVKGDTGNSIFYTYNDSLEKPSVPTGAGNTNGWHTESTDAVVWMSIKSAKSIGEGSWGTPFRVKGAGTSITIKGSKSSVSELPTTGNAQGDSYIIGRNLYVWDGTSWQNMGQIKGDDGTSSYLHLKYSDDGGKTFTAGNGETPGRYIGMYVDQSITDSDNPKRYAWRDAQGTQGIPGEPGEDGRTSYLHIKYSDNGGLSFTAHNGEDAGAWIGQYTDFEEMDSDDPTRYTWSRLTGVTGAAGSDSAAGEYYEYRYAKNGSTLAPPDLDVNDPDPSGWSKTMPTVGALEYIWCTMCKKSALVDRTKVHVPVSAAGKLKDTSGNGYNGTLSGGSVVTDGTREVLKLTGENESRIPYDLPFGESFTLCFWMKTSLSPVKWMITAYNGRDYVENEVAVKANTWYHFAFRFNDTTCTLFLNGEQQQIATVSDSLVGFSLYDDNLFGSTVEFDEVRIMMGALAVTDIQLVMNDTVDKLIQIWATPFRVNPYDGKDGKDAVSVKNVDVEYAKSTSSTTAPTSGWQTDAPTWENGKYIWSRTKVTYTDGNATTTKAVCITGSKGASGTDGDDGVGISSITEQYYLSSSNTTQVNGSWVNTYPGWKDGWYLWTRSVIKYTNGTSITTSPTCVTGSKGAKGDKGDPGAKGDKGDSPVLVFRGVYNNSTNVTYYGTSRRVDAVRYNGIYYIARIDAGEFSSVAPTDTSKWNTFGAQFESIATNLLLAEGANIGDWFMSGGKIVSTLSTGNNNKITLDASMAQILIESNTSGGSNSLYTTMGAKITLDAYNGIVNVNAKYAPSYSTGTAYLSPSGIFANLAATDGMPASSGYTHRGAIVGLGFAQVAKSDWAVNAIQTMICGVYGRASNNSTAPAFGGFFYDLYAGGLTLGRKCVTGTANNTTTLSSSDSIVIGYTSAVGTVYLPSSPKEGQVIFVKQWWTGTMRFRPYTGQHIYDDSSENEYYDFGQGQGGMFVFTIGYITKNNVSTKVEAWLVSRWKY